MKIFKTAAATEGADWKPSPSGILLPPSVHEEIAQDNEENEQATSANIQALKTNFSNQIKAKKDELTSRNTQLAEYTEHYRKVYDAFKGREYAWRQSDKEECWEVAVQATKAANLISSILNAGFFYSIDNLVQETTIASFLKHKIIKESFFGIEFLKNKFKKWRDEWNQLASTKEEQEAMTKTKEEMRNLAEATNISLIEEISTIINESIAEINKITPPTSESTDFLGVLNQATEDLGEINNSMGGAGETAAASGKLKIYKKSKFSKRIKRSWL